MQPIAALPVSYRSASIQALLTRICGPAFAVAASLSVPCRSFVLAPEREDWGGGLPEVLPKEKRGRGQDLEEVTGDGPVGRATAPGPRCDQGEHAAGREGKGRGGGWG